MDQLRNFALLNTGRDHQHSARETCLFCRLHELDAIVLPKVIVQQNNVDVDFSQNLQSFLDGPTRRDDLKPGFGSQKPCNALPEKCMVIHQQNRDRLLQCVNHSMSPLPTANEERLQSSSPPGFLQSAGLRRNSS